MAFKLAVAQGADAVTHIVSDPARGIGKRLIPVIEKQSRQCMGLVVVHEDEWNIRPETIVC